MLDDKITIIQRPVIPECFRNDRDLSKAFLMGYLAAVIATKSKISCKASL